MNPWCSAEFGEEDTEYGVHYQILWVVRVQEEMRGQGEGLGGEREREEEVGGEGREGSGDARDEGFAVRYQGRRGSCRICRRQSLFGGYVRRPFEEWVEVG